MGFATSEGGVGLHYEEAGEGTPVLFIHEFAGDHRSWEPQVRFLSRRHRCVTYAARGYPPSDVPTDPEAYSQDLAVADALAVLDHLGVERAHIVGQSLGGWAAMGLAIAHPDRVGSSADGCCPRIVTDHTDGQSGAGWHCNDVTGSGRRTPRPSPTTSASSGRTP